VVQVMDSATYSDPPDFTAVRDCTLQAAEEQRPYLKLNNFWRFTSDAPGAELTLDGLWIGTWSAARSVVLATSGTHDFAQVTLRACTLDPGGEDAGGAELPPVSLIIEGHVGTLVVDQCVLSSIQLKNASSSVDHLVLRDSMIHARLPGTIPLQLPACHLEMQRCTVLGPSLDALTIVVERLEASDVLVAGLVQVSDTQSGCFRFSARTQASIVPHPYRSAMVDDLPRLFASRRFGDPHYLNLSQTAPKEISRGAENGREMGCFAGADLPVKEDSLRAKIEEFMPFGRLPNLLIEN